MNNVQLSDRELLSRLHSLAGRVLSTKMDADGAIGAERIAYATRDYELALSALGQFTPNVEAALAQNTQGVMVDFAGMGSAGPFEVKDGTIHLPEVTISDLQDRIHDTRTQNTQGDGVLCPSCGYRVSFGAERARVPADIVLIDGRLYDVETVKTALLGLATELAAAPSKRAEVK